MFFFFFFNDTATTEIYTLSLHDALPISMFAAQSGLMRHCGTPRSWSRRAAISKRSEEHTSELQSRLHLVCRLLLEKKKKKNKNIMLTDDKDKLHQTVHEMRQHVLYAEAH